MTALKKNRFASARAPDAQPAKSVTVLGAGLMGAGIVQVSAEKGLKVIMKDRDAPALGKGEDYITGNLDKKVKRKSMTAYKRNTIVSNVVPMHDGSDVESWARHLSTTDVVIEAVPENLELKHRVIQACEPLLAPTTVFATNTSAIPIADVAAGASRPERVIGMHYFSPVPQMPLLEIIPHAGTAPDACAIAVEVGIKQGKTCIIVKDVPGFYVNRCLAPMLAEVFPLFQDGVTPEQLDKAMKAMGMPVGPITLIDEVGADVGLHVTETMVADPTMGARMAGADPKKMEEMVEKGWLGKKSGRGFFEYDKKGKRQGMNQDANKLIETEVKQRDLKLTTEQIQDRMMSRFVNEAALCLQEGVIENAVDGDMGAVFGVGFLPHYGGPFRMLDILGVDGYVEKMKGMAGEYGEQFEPCALLQDHARASKLFHARSTEA
jgi:enoyl-CoA hydratase/long-chain 3-hydroxyacyl-CoA dehydrogenase